MKNLSLLAFLIFLVSSCSSSEQSGSETSVEVTDSVQNSPNNEMSEKLGTWVHDKGGGNQTKYEIEKADGSLILETTSIMPNQEPFSSREKLVETERGFVRESEVELDQPYAFKQDGNTLTIYDSFGEYAKLGGLQ